MITEISLKKRWVELQCRGWTDSRIAEETNSDLKWVRHFLRANNLKALQRMASQRAAERAKQVMRLERMIEECALAYERSCMPEDVIEVIEEPAGSQGQVTVQGPPGATPGSYHQVQPAMTTIRTKKTTRYKNGDVNYLKAMQGFMQDVRSILKIDDGTKRIDFSLSMPGEDQIKATVNIHDLASDQLQDWNAQQKDRLQKMLEMEPPEIAGSSGADSQPRNGDS